MQPYAAPVKATTQTKPKSKLPLFIGIGAAVVVIALAIILISGLSGGGNEALGRYEGVSMSMMGFTVESEDLGDTWLELKEDDEFVLVLDGDRTKGTWELDDDELTLESGGEEVCGTLEDGVIEITIEEEGVKMVMVFAKDGAETGRTEKPVDAPVEAPQPSAAATEAPETIAPTEAPVAAGNYGWWEGDWYGWWIVTGATGAFEQYVDEYWDAYARIDILDGTAGRIVIWDEDLSYQAPLANVEIEFEEGFGEKGSFASAKGEFDGTSIGYYDWLVDPAASPVSEFKDMIAIEGTYVDPDNGENTYEYIIILRPWGMDWEDVKTADTSDALYDDMMPAYYEDWYMPLVEMGAELPNSKDEGEDLLD